MSKKTRTRLTSNAALGVKQDYTYIFALISDQVNTHIELTEYIGSLGITMTAHVLNIIVSIISSLKDYSDQFVTENTRISNDEKVEVAGSDFVSEFSICDEKGSVDDRALGKLHEAMMEYHLSKLDELYAAVSETSDLSIAKELIQARQYILHGQAAIANYNAVLS